MFSFYSRHGDKAMQSKLRERATSASGLKRIGPKAWNQNTPEYHRSLYESMLRRMNSVIEAQGGHTMY